MSRHAIGRAGELGGLSYGARWRLSHLAWTWSRQRKSQPDEAPWRNGQVLTSASPVGADVCAEMKRELLNVRKYVKHAWEVELVCTQTVNVYHAGPHPPERRRGCAACPTAFSPSICCWHLAHLYPDGYKHHVLCAHEYLKVISDSFFFFSKRQHFEERDSNYSRPHCNYDARRELCAEVIIQ